MLHQAKKLPDVLLIQVDWVAEFADLGMIEPLDERIAKEPKEFFANIPATFHQQWRGKQYYLPIESGAVALFYNTDLFKAAGLSGPPKTWDEFAEYARKLTNPDKRQFATTGTLAGEPPTNMTYEIYPLLLQAGAKLIDATTNKAVFNSPEGVAAVEWYVDRINKDKISVPGVLSNGEKEKRANFASGNIAMMFEGPWGIAIQKQLNPNLNYDIATAARRQDDRHDGARLAERAHQPGAGQGSGLGLHALDVGAEGHRDVGEGHRRLPGADGCVEPGLVQGAQAVSGLRHADEPRQRAVALPGDAQRRADEQDHDDGDPERRAGQEERQAGAR